MKMPLILAEGQREPDASVNVPDRSMSSFDDVTMY
jgi:hypothetical protein